MVTAMALVVRRHWPEQREWSRKVVHIGTGPVVLLAWWLQIDRAIALPAAALVTLATALNHRFRLLPAVEDVGRHSYGTIAYGGSITLLLIAAAATALEQCSGYGIDNLSVPLATALLWQQFTP